MVCIKTIQKLTVEQFHMMYVQKREVLTEAEQNGAKHRPNFGTCIKIKITVGGEYDFDIHFLSVLL